MKSIKEKAIETYPALEGDLYSTSENLVRRDGFKTSANYVLEQIENVLNNPYQCTFKTLKANIEELIIKLKEK